VGLIRSSEFEPQWNPASFWRIQIVRGTTMAKLGIYVALKAKPGKEQEVDEFLRSALPLVQAEAGTVTWYAIRHPETGSFGIFDTFEDEAGRQAHLTGAVAKALFAKAPDLFSEAPAVDKLEILAKK
jgi:quinol monooxygenase YgiN